MDSWKDTVVIVAVIALDSLVLLLCIWVLRFTVPLLVKVNNGIKFTFSETVVLSFGITVGIIEMYGIIGLMLHQAYPWFVAGIVAGCGISFWRFVKAANRQTISGGPNISPRQPSWDRLDMSDHERVVWNRLVEAESSPYDKKQTSTEDQA